MLRRTVEWIGIAVAAVVGIAYGRRSSLGEDAFETLTTLVVVGLFVQWVFRRNEDFKAGRFWCAMLAAGMVMVGLRWMVHQ